MSRRVCKVCGEFEEDHHIPDWLEIPDGCVCNWREWDFENMKSLPPICEEYKGNGTLNCERCEHDKECHEKPLEMVEPEEGEKNDSKM